MRWNFCRIPPTNLENRWVAAEPDDYELVMMSRIRLVCLFRSASVIGSASRSAFLMATMWAISNTTGSSSSGPG